MTFSSQCVTHTHTQSSPEMWQRIKNSLSGLQTLFESALSMCLCVYLSLYVFMCFICLCACVLCGFLRLVFLLFLIYANIDRVREAVNYTHTLAGTHSGPLLIVSCRVVSGPITRAVRDLG